MLFGACVLSFDESSLVPCATDLDCPVLFVCADVGDGASKVCQAKGVLPQASEGQETPSNPNNPGPATPSVVTYCKDVKPLLDKQCKGCHGASGVVPGFRLDVYETVGSTKGAGEMAGKIKETLSPGAAKPMPPAGLPAPSDAERQTYLDWVNGGAIECEAPSTPSTPSNPSNPTTPGNTPDAGGTPSTPTPPPPPPPDAGTAVSFAADVQPIFQLRCGTACHLNGNTSGGVNLATAAQSYNSLVNKASTCNTAVLKVKPSDTANSMMWRKLNGASNRCGNVMPPAGALANVQPAEFQIIEKWIAQGAKND